MEEKIMQITSGKGPGECERVVAKVVSKIKKQAEQKLLSWEVVELVNGKFDNSFLSALIRIRGNGVADFCKEWKGTIQWIAQSPFRKFHKRKNWFVGINVFDVSDFAKWNEKDISYQTMRASGPGGQHVNKTESAVRATHLPSGISVTASTERSQMMNKKEATERLKNKLLSLEIEKSNQLIQDQWMEHNSLTRGNAVKIFKEPLD
jgi:peptide chain release factor